MTSAVVDASVAVKWVVEEEHSNEASLLLAYNELHAPSHWQAEAVNALWSKVFKRELAADDAEERMTLLLRAPVTGTAIPELMPRAFAISVAQSVTIYDSLYVALAEQRRLPLITADRTLFRRLSESKGGAAQLTWIGDIRSVP